MAFEKGLTWGDWVAFVDDDGTVAIFRMLMGERIISQSGRNKIVRNDVCISFVVRTFVLEKFRFDPSSTEDFAFLRELEDAGFTFTVSRKRRVSPKIGFVIAL